MSTTLTIINLINETVAPTLAATLNNDTSYGYSGNETSSSYGNDYNTSKDDYGYGSDSAYGESAYGSDSAYGESAYGGEKKEYGDDFYYGAMSVAVLTLGLVIVVEAILHRIDMSAIGKPFYQAVLDAVYRELAVLGIVELGVHIMAQLYAYDKNKKAVFADVHFLLFYTDIFNALQAAAQAYATRWFSHKLWVRTECLELDHYVEIREEYDRVVLELYGDNYDGSTIPTWRKFLRNVMFWITRPGLMSQYKELLVQVRFHELRVYFLQSYKLPLKFKVSDYLMRSEDSVMLSLVHITPTAWFWLTALCNLLYYLAGVISDQSGEGKDAASFYAACFFAFLFLFVVLSAALDSHMQRVFHQIMKRKYLWAHDVDNGKDFEIDEELADEQRSLFWLGDPKLVVSICQFVQLGYAIAISVVITYWKDMSKDDHDISPHWYLWSTIIFYALFVYNMARVIPRYTLCTNLGQLVDKHALHEAVASYKLKEAERVRTQKMEEEEYYFNDDIMMSNSHSMNLQNIYKGSQNVVDTTLLKKNDSDSGDETQASPSEATATSSNSPTSNNVIPSVVRTVPPEQGIADFVKMDTNSLREAAADQRARNRSAARRKARSEGVGKMRSMTIDENSSTDDASADYKTSTSFGELINADGAPVFDREQLLANLVRMDTTSLRQIVPPSSSVTSSGRRKSSSSGVFDMASGTNLNNSGSNLVLGDGSAGGARRTRTNSAGSSIRLMRFAEGDHSVSGHFDMMEASIALSDVGEVQAGHIQKYQLQHDDDHHDDKHDDHHHEKLSCHEWLCAYFAGPTFRLLSHVLGTLIVFFIVGMRVEGFLQKSCIVPEDDYSWDLPLEWTFLLESVWLLIAFAMSALVLVTFAGKEDMNRDEYTTVIAAMLDLALVGTCIGLLFGSEAQRCCTDDDEEPVGETNGMYYDSRFLAEYGDEKEICKDATLECTCADFGFRVSGGLGSVEPWTALIALQAFRFLVAKRIAKRMGLGEKVHHDHDDHGHGHGHHGGGSGPEQIADAWQTAVKKHPELVAKYGEFSGEVLQAMLGLDVIERARPSSVQALPASGDVAKYDSGTAGRRGSIVLTDARFKHIGPAAQEIIAAGVVGMPVKISDGATPQKSSSLATVPAAPLEFEVDKEQSRIERLQLTTTFEFPNARIIRSVRRCDKMYLPFAQKWTAVDVIMTNHEMVYVEVNDGADLSMAEMKKTGAMRQALKATKGGKGLRLCDITACRRVVGHLNLEDITAVHVDRELPQPTITEVDVDVEESKVIMKPSELWQAGGDRTFDADAFADRWDAIQQDKLKIETKRGTLYLRFYSDLIDTETHPERKSNEENLHKDISFQWAQTIAHLCVDQLKQSLPHFGDNNTEELRDYLQMVSC